MTFEVERAEANGDELVVCGRWSGVRGMRFMRPTLVVDGRPLLATLERKPWAPDTDPWVAAFPWPGGKVDLATMALAVAPSVTVPLDPDAEPLPAAAPVATRPAREPAPTPAAEDTDRIHIERLETEIGFLREKLREVTAERDALRGEAEAAKARKGRCHTRGPHRRGVPRRAQRRPHRGRARPRPRHHAARRGGPRPRCRRPTRAADRGPARRGGAGDGVPSAPSWIGRAERAEAIARRDDVLLAHESLQRNAKTALADEDRERFERADGVPSPDEVGPDEPIGVRTIPAARTVAADLDRTRRPPGRDVSPADLWAIRIFGSIAAVCFITLLAMILRVFL